MFSGNVIQSDSDTCSENRPELNSMFCFLNLLSDIVQQCHSSY